MVSTLEPTHALARPCFHKRLCMHTHMASSMHLHACIRVSLNLGCRWMMTGWYRSHTRMRLFSLVASTLPSTRSTLRQSSRRVGVGVVVEVAVWESFGTRIGATGLGTGCSGLGLHQSSRNPTLTLTLALTQTLTPSPPTTQPQPYPKPSSRSPFLASSMMVEWWSSHAPTSPGRAPPSYVRFASDSVTRTATPS